MHILLLHHVVEDRWPSNSRWFLPSFSFPFFCTVHGILQGRILEWVAIPLLQGIFPTQGLNPGLPHCRQILYQLSHKGSPKILEWVAYPFFRGMSPTQESNQGLLNCRWILYLSALREAPLLDNMLVQIWELQCYTDRIRHLKSKSVTCSVMCDSLKPHGL